MSYDLILFSPKASIETSLVVEQLLKTDWDDDLANDLLTPIDLNVKRALVAALSRRYLSLSVNPSSFLSQADELAHTPEENEPEIVELTDLASGQGVQISIFLTNISVSWPYWHAGVKAVQVIQTVNDYLETVRAVWPCQVYDSQLGRLLEDKLDFEQAASLTSWITSLFQRRK